MSLELVGGMLKRLHSVSPGRVTDFVKSQLRFRHGELLLNFCSVRLPEVISYFGKDIIGVRRTSAPRRDASLTGVSNETPEKKTRTGSSRGQPSRLSAVDR